MTVIAASGFDPSTARPSEKPTDWLSRKEAAAYLTRIGCRVSVRTLEKKAGHDNAGNGPSFTRSMLRTVRYMRRDLDAWAYRNTRRVP